MFRIFPLILHDIATTAAIWTHRERNMNSLPFMIIQRMWSQNLNSLDKLLGLFLIFLPPNAENLNVISNVRYKHMLLLPYKTINALEMTMFYGMLKWIDFHSGTYGGKTRNRFFDSIWKCVLFIVHNICIKCVCVCVFVLCAYA